MRDIKFKGVHPDTGIVMDVCVIDWTRDEVYFEEDADIVYPMHDCKLMQFTGLKDKNGNEIYIGHIIKVDTPKDGIYLTSIERYKGVFGFFSISCKCVKNPNGWDNEHNKTESGWFFGGFSSLAGFGYSKLEDCDAQGNQLCVEVIGNIHENPELLGAKQ